MGFQLFISPSGLNDFVLLADGVFGWRVWSGECEFGSCCGDGCADNVLEFDCPNAKQTLVWRRLQRNARRRSTSDKRVRTKVASAAAVVAAQRKRAATINSRHVVARRRSLKRATAQWIVARAVTNRNVACSQRRALQDCVLVTLVWA